MRLGRTMVALLVRDAERSTGVLRSRGEPPSNRGLALREVDRVTTYLRAPFRRILASW